MITLDTNVLVRLLIDDQDVAQIRAARKLAQKAKQVFIPQIVQVELIWVLVRAYGFEKPQVIFILNELCKNAAYVLQHEEAFSEAVQLFTDNTIDFSDCLIYVMSHEEKSLPLYTFDKKFLKLKNTKSP
jgi:predicted nucleic-acid-binding protein